MEFLELAHYLLQQFAKLTISHVPRNDNEAANNLAQQASGFWLRMNEINNIKIAEAQPEENKDWRQEHKLK